MVRPTWDEFFINIAKEVAKRSTCDRANVGCVAVDKDNQVVATGYNGSISGMPHCDDVGHLVVNNHCLRSEHSERNLLASAARRGASIKGGTLYTSHFPCWFCFRLLCQAGISTIKFDQVKKNDILPEVIPLIEAAPTKLLHISGVSFTEHLKTLS